MDAPVIKDARETRAAQGERDPLTRAFALSPALKRAPEALARLCAALEAAGVDYAIGGALAVACWAAPRATKDVDLTLFGADEGLIQSARGLPCPVTLHDPEAPLARAARERRCPVPFGASQVQVWDATATLAFALAEGRPKQIIDAAALVAAQPAFDRAWVDARFEPQSRARRALARLLR